MAHAQQLADLAKVQEKTANVELQHCVQELKKLIESYYQDVNSRTSKNNPLNIAVKRLKKIFDQENHVNKPTDNIEKIEKFYRK